MAIAVVWYRGVPAAERQEMRRFALRMLSAVTLSAAVGVVASRIGDVVATAAAISAFVAAARLLGIDEVAAVLRRLLRSR
jgi:hypothetical protein